MAIATSPQPLVRSHSKGDEFNQIQISDKPNCAISMSEDYHQGIFNFPSGFHRAQDQEQQQQHHIAQQIRRDKQRVPGFEPQHTLVAMEEDVTGGIPVYQTAGGMLSEMFNFPHTAATELLETQISQNYRYPRQPVVVGGDEWYGNRQGIGVGCSLGPMGDSKNQTVMNNRESFAVDQHGHPHPHHHHQISSINAESSSSAAAAAMQLFLMNPKPRSPPSPSPSSHPSHETTSNTLHMLLPNPSISSTSTLQQLQGFQNSPITTASVSQPGGSFGQFTWVPDNGTGHGGGSNPSEIGGTMVEGQGLSLSLSSSLSLHQLEAAKAQELRMGNGGGMLLFNQGGGGGGGGGGGDGSNNNSGTNYPYKTFISGNQSIHVGYGTSLGVVNVLRNSKYVTAAQELLEEFCSVGRCQFKKNKFSRQNSNSNPTPGRGSGSSSGGGGSSSSKDIPALSAADRIEHQRRKVKLLTMLDEVERRYNHYCEQMQMVVNSFDLVMGFGSAVPYTALAQKAMSRHFRCLKDAIAAQLKQSCELLGDKDAGTSGVTKGETPRLKLLEQSLRQQRAFHQMGMMEQEAWRPQRGLPERSVNILRAWLFEHFLHPYPSDADKHLLARQTGLSRNQVSNWFINARVRLWKPMVEDMYQQESKEEAEEVEEDDKEVERETTDHPIAQTPTPTPLATTTTNITATNTTTPTIPLPGKRSEINAFESDLSRITINRQCFSSENQAIRATTTSNYTTSTTVVPAVATMAPLSYPTIHDSDTYRTIGIDYGTTTATSGNAADTGSTLIRFGTSSGDVSLTLGLRHAGNVPDKTLFSVRDFGAC